MVVAGWIKKVGRISTLTSPASSSVYKQLCMASSIESILVQLPSDPALKSLVCAIAQIAMQKERITKNERVTFLLQQSKIVWLCVCKIPQKIIDLPNFKL